MLASPTAGDYRITTCDVLPRDPPLPPRVSRVAWVRRPVPSAVGSWRARLSVVGEAPQSATHGSSGATFTTTCSSGHRQQARYSRGQDHDRHHCDQGGDERVMLTLRACELVVGAGHGGLPSPLGMGEVCAGAPRAGCALAHISYQSERTAAVGHPLARVIRRLRLPGYGVPSRAGLCPGLSREACWP